MKIDSHNNIINVFYNVGMEFGNTNPPKVPQKTLKIDKIECKRVTV